MANDSHPFLYQRLAASVSDLIEFGTLKSGDRIPSVRRFAQQQGVSISTVLQTYHLLEARGVIRASPKSGFYVRSMSNRALAEPEAPKLRIASRNVAVGDLAARVCGSASDPDVVLFGAAIPSPELLPSVKLGQLLRSVVRREGPGINTYLLEGSIELRREIARRALDSGFAVAPGDILVTVGCTEALMLCLRAVAQPGDSIVVESPTYFGILQLLESLHLRAIEVPTHPRRGIDLDALKRVLKRKDVRACVVVPNGHNPLGCVLDDDSKRNMVALCAERQIPLVEDDIYGDLHFADSRPKSLMAFDDADVVLQCSSFSKTLAPGYRIGWVVAGPFLEAVKRNKLASTIATSVPDQLAIAEFLAKGGYDHHLRRMRQIYQRNIATMTDVIARAFPDGTNVTKPAAGFVLWVELPDSVDTVELYQRALDRGISFGPGAMFSATDRYRNFLRLNCALSWTDRTEHALELLGELAVGMASMS